MKPDDLIRLHKSLAQTNSEVHSALSKALEEASEYLSQQTKFATAVQLFQQKLLHDLGESNVEIQSYLAKFVEGIEAITQSIVSRLSTAVDAVETDIAGLKEVRESTAQGHCITNKI